MNMDQLRKYPCVIQPLPEEDGGGFLATFPDLPLVASDGPTPAEALANGLDALKCALEALQAWGRPTPQPGLATGKMALRLPKSLHLRLMTRAEAEGVSINTTAISLIAEGLGRHEGAVMATIPRTRQKPARKAS